MHARDDEHGRLPQQLGEVEKGADRAGVERVDVVHHDQPRALPPRQRLADDATADPDDALGTGQRGDVVEDAGEPAAGLGADHHQTARAAPHQVLDLGEHVRGRHSAERNKTRE
ncbi:hypothetical protein ACFQV2_21085 [Actinokineospora soli]|uniref:Uncharacterized protein n=1 Tax=Actinokineospora soli TaxID=1048753 RepID=A0ABW2TP93_9PSEU